MTANERASLERLEDKFDARFDKLESLMETRRVEIDSSVGEIDERLRSVEKIAYAAGALGSVGLALGVAFVSGWTG